MTKLFLVLVLLWCLANGFPLGKQKGLLTGPDFLAMFMRKSLPVEPTTTDNYYRHNDVFQRPDDEPPQEEFRLEDLELQKQFPVNVQAADTTTMFAQEVFTTDEPATEEPQTDPPSQVVSVRVSSSVVRGKPEGKMEDSVLNESKMENVLPEGEKLDEAAAPPQEQAVLVQEDSLKDEAILGTQDQPALNAAIQRSHLGVDESSRSISYSSPPEEVSYSSEHTVYRVEGRQSKYQRVPDSYAEASQLYHSQAEVLKPQTLPKSQEIEKIVKPKDEPKADYARAEALTQYQMDNDPQKKPISYQTSVSSATSGSRVQFYREPPRPQQQENKPRNYELQEQVYGTPEVNYEVEEAVSVVTNGRAHGVQERPSPDIKNQQDPSANPNHKFGYVVEGRNFRKYRVEERTADGFIVGEYGVVSHDDGSLRGVRYTADSTINPRLIYDALVKFLSLK